MLFYGGYNGDADLASIHTKVDPAVNGMAVCRITAHVCEKLSREVRDRGVVSHGLSIARPDIELPFLNVACPITLTLAKMLRPGNRQFWGLRAHVGQIQSR